MNVDAPDINMMHAQECMQANELDTALLWLEKARSEFAEQPDDVGELRVLLLLAQIYHRREDLGTAQLFTEEATDLLYSPQSDLTPAQRGEGFLGLARLAPDIGQLRQALRYADAALRLVEDAGQVESQMEILLLAASIAQQMGHIQTALARLEVARQRLEASSAGQGGSLWTWLFNTEAHNAWYRGHLLQALVRAEEAIHAADAARLDKYRVYNRLLRANLLRELERYPAAHTAYDETERVLSETDFPLFRVWLWAHRAWLAIRETRYTDAKRLLYRALETADQGQAASFNVFLAVAYSLTDRYTEAEDLFRGSLHFYQTSGDELSVFALRVHLAYICLQQGRTAKAEEHITLALDWAAYWNVDYFPHWWHPQIVATVCVHGLVAGIHPSMAERILVKRVGPAAAAVLHPLVGADDPVVARRTADVLTLLEPRLLGALAEAADTPVRQILESLLASGRLRPETLPNLIERLSAGRARDRINPVLLATFGLYVHDTPRREIAALLGRSESTIRNYITLIYEQFGLADAGGSRRARRKRLRQRALEKGFVG